MNVIVRPQFYLDLEDEVFWLLTNAGANVAQRWHEAGADGQIASGASTPRSRTQRPHATGNSLVADQTLSAVACFLFAARRKSGDLSHPFGSDEFVTTRNAELNACSRTGHHGFGGLGRFVTVALPPSSAISYCSFHSPRSLTRAGFFIGRARQSVRAALIGRARQSPARRSDQPHPPGAHGVTRPT